MDTITCQAPGVLRLIQTDEPLPKEGEALLQIRQVGICGTDLHAFEGTQPYFSYPRILGHELAAEILDIPTGYGFSVGDQVTVKPYFHCGKCVACRQGKTNCCAAMQVYGVHIDGGMRSRIALPLTALIKGEGLDADHFSLVEPLAIGAHGLRRAAVKSGEYILVIGAGPIGIGTLLLARAAGSKVIVMDTNAARLRYCATLVSDLDIINATDPDAYEQIHALTSGDMPNVVFDCTGSQRAINGAFRYMAHGGRYVLIGLQQHDITFNHPEFHKREGTLMSSRNATIEDFDHVINLLQQGSIPATSMITHRIEHRELPASFASLLNPNSGVIKAVAQFAD